MYILASQKRGTLYIGVTNDIWRRVHEHRHGLVAGFTKKYHISKLVYVEIYGRIEEAIAREKQLKHWLRSWKIQLIDAANPEWKDLSVIDNGSMDPRLREDDTVRNDHDCLEKKKVSRV